MYHKIMIYLTYIKLLIDFQKVSCTAKVIDIDNPVEVSGGKTKQDLRISDSSGSIRLTV